LKLIRRCGRPPFLLPLRSIPFFYLIIFTLIVLIATSHEKVDETHKQKTNTTGQIGHRIPNARVSHRLKK
jgi:hypothetical protein